MPNLKFLDETPGWTNPARSLKHSARYLKHSAECLGKNALQNVLSGYGNEEAIVKTNKWTPLFAKILENETTIKTVC